MIETTSHRVRDFMHENVITATPQTTLRQAIEIMARSKTNGLVIIGDERTVVGILSTLDIISYIVPDYLENDKHLASFEAENIFAKRITELAEDPVEQFMTKHVHTVKENHSLIEAATLLAEHRIRQLPVVNDANQLVGYISRTNLKHAIAAVLGIEPTV